MISAIGLMVGAYIITRMFSMLIPRQENGKLSPIVVALAWVTIVVAIVGIGIIIESDFSASGFGNF